MHEIRHFSDTEIQTLVPHRFENIVVDSAVQIQTELTTRGEFTLNIGYPDRLGRHIFTREVAPQHRVILSTVVMEILALGSIVCSNKASANTLVFFAGITNFERFLDAPTNHALEGWVEKRKDKAGFLLCEGALETSTGECIAKGQMMAYFPGSHEGASETPKKTVELPASTCAIAVPKDPHKDASMTVLDQLCHADLEQKTALFSYVFPNTHPLIKGHFPGRPVMMGVMQWMMVEDAIQFLSSFWKTRWPQGTYTVSGSADLIKSDGTSVCEIRKYEVVVVTEGRDTPLATLTKTAKISFRDAVVPGEIIYIHLHGLNVS